MAGGAATSPVTREMQPIVEEFFREGCVRVPGMLTPEEAAALRAKTDRFAADESLSSRHRTWSRGDTFVLRYCHELDPLFAEVAARESMVSLAAAVLDSGAAFNAMNVIRNEPGQAISHWHVDDRLEFPLPDEISRFDARLRMPVLWLTLQVALSDIDTLEHGPSQFVPGSHYSGRYPPKSEAPEFEGRGPVSMLCKAGDVYLFNHQCWHRGAPNLSDRTRYLMQLQYAQRWADRRFKGFG
jgi:ectoine hydroxylase-related dioxygenase (phytanoyl-CoA dioxygenase family)